MPLEQVSHIAFEVCCTSLASAQIAEATGADRIELCQNLDCGGLTASYGLIKAVTSTVSIPVHVLIRPCPGPTIYTAEQIQVMIADIEMCKTLNVAGVVIGAITDQGEIDFHTTRALVAAAGKLHVTFHRGLDDCTYSSTSEIEEALEGLLAAGCTRVLTSGLAPNATTGSSTIRSMVDWSRDKAGNRLEIMAGAGIKSGNVEQLITTTRVRAVHMTAKGSSRPTSNTRGLFGTAEPAIDADELRASLDYVRRIGAGVVGESLNP